MTEGDIQRAIQLEASKRGARLFRNNTGMLPDKRGIPVRFGLCPGSSDLIGWTRDGRFLAIEVKTARGRPTKAQLKFIKTVNDAGGIGLIARSPDDLSCL